MDIISELNLQSYKTYFQRAWKSWHTICVNLGQGHPLYLLKLPETKIIRYMETAISSLSGVQAEIAVRTLRKEIGITKVFKGRMFAWQEIKI